MTKKLTPIESKILTVLIKDGDYMTTAQVAEKSAISWNTAFIYLNRFYKLGWVEKEGERTVYWKAVLEE